MTARERTARNTGEVGDTVLYVCGGGAAHNAPEGVCDPGGGDVHPAIVAEVLNRDADGLPAYVLLALMLPMRPTVTWIKAQHAPRTPGEGHEVTRLHRGAPPAEAMQTPGASVFHVLDFPRDSWHAQGE